MSERAHPEDRAFQDRWVLTRLWSGCIPWPLFRRSPWKRGLIERYQFCQPYVRGKRVLDIPCGTGWGTSMLNGARSLIGLDLSPQAVAFARASFGRRARFCVGHMAHLPFAGGALDTLICLEGIEHVPQKVGKAFVEEAARVLSPGGEVIVTSPIPDPNRPPNPYHIHEYEADELESMLASRFQRRRVEIRNMGGVEIVFYVGQRRSA
jgi:ubiquinone/menaquinone biosynthesis C-methylase UbiE